MSDCPFCVKLADLSSVAADEMVWRFPESVALLGPWQRYTGYCILVSRRHARELSQLTVGGRHSFLDEMSQLARAIESAFAPRKMNYELLGNQVPHLHWHLFPRPHDDDDPLRPVWFAIDRAERDDAERTELRTGTLPRMEIIARLRTHLLRIAGGES